MNQALQEARHQLQALHRLQGLARHLLLLRTDSAQTGSAVCQFPDHFILSGIMKKAFTLIELLVVIAIIAILAAILFPVFAQAKQAAKQTSSLSNVKQLMTSVLIYNGDYDDNTMTELWQNRGDGEWTTWMETLLPYVKNTQIFLDPGGTTDKNAVGVTGCTSVAGARVFSNWAMINWIRYDYWGWWGTTLFGGFPVAPTPGNSGTGGTCDTSTRPCDLPRFSVPLIRLVSPGGQLSVFEMKGGRSPTGVSKTRPRLRGCQASQG